MATLQVIEKYLNSNLIQILIRVSHMTEALMKHKNELKTEKNL